MTRVAVSRETAHLPEILQFPTREDSEALIDEALRIAKLALTDAANTLERLSPGGHGAERLRMMAERMEDLLESRAPSILDRFRPARS